MKVKTKEQQQILRKMSLQICDDMSRNDKALAEMERDELKMKDKAQ